MAKTISTPRERQASDETVGPNFPSSVDPGFGDQWRSPGGDVGRVGRVTGRTPEKPDPGQTAEK